MKPAVAIVGAGRIGTALGILLHQAGYPIAGVVCRTEERAQRAVEAIGAGRPLDDIAKGVRRAKRIFVCVADGDLPEIAERVASGRRFRSDDLLIHTSGALPADVLRVKGVGKAMCLSMHPIQTVADPRTGAERLRGVSWGLEGDDEAIPIGKEIVADLHGVPLVVQPGKKALYHAAATVASNYLVTLVAASVELYGSVGFGRKEALAALRPLLEGTLANLEAHGLPWALTGPIDRGDVDTVRKHLEAIRDLEHLEGLYRMLGLHTLRLVEEKEGGLKPSHRGIRDLLQGVHEE